MDVHEKSKMVRGSGGCGAGTRKNVGGRDLLE